MLDEQVTQVVPVSGFGLLILLFWSVFHEGVYDII